ncbi:MAG: ABC transporter permease [Chloroflexi bacterium]|nr:ABC transporter permease [Chloroflexota bacterium]
MREYVIKRILLMIPTLIGVSLIVFALVKAVPGDVVMIMLAEAPGFTQSDVDRLRAELGLDKPAHIQYLTWLGNAARGDLGKSLWTGKPVWDEIVARMPITLELGVFTLLVSTIVALVFGVISAIRQDTPLDYFLRFTSILGLSVPNFWIGTLLVVFPAIWWGYMPSLTYVPFDQDPLGNLKQFMFPAVAIGLRGSASVMRLTRSSLLEVMRQDYIRTAHAKGLRERVVIWKHALKNALIPVVTIVGQQFSTVLGGTVVIEQIFGLPGMGRLMLESIQQRDLTQLQGNVLVIALAFVVINLLVDVSYAWLDPRIKF